MSWSIIAKVAASSSDGNGFGPTTDINSTGADTLIFAAMGLGAITDVGTPSDSKSNTWGSPAGSFNSNGCTIFVWIIKPPGGKVGASHNFSYAGSGLFANIAVFAVSGGAASSPYDNGTSTTTANALNTIATGSLTPAQDGELIIALLTAATLNSFGGGGTVTIDDADFTIQFQSDNAGGAHRGFAIATAIEGSPKSAKNATWTAVPAGGFGNFGATAAIIAIKGPAIPALTSATPNYAAVGSGDTSITLTGTNFDAASVVNLNGSPLATYAFTNSTTMTATLTAAELAGEAILQLTVSTPGVGTSGQIPFNAYGTAGAGVFTETGGQALLTASGLVGSATQGLTGLDFEDALNPRRFVITITTAADGSAIAYTPNFSGRVVGLHYVKDGSTAFSDGVSLAAAGEATGEPILGVANMNATAHYYPRPSSLESSPLDNDRLVLTIASGGNAKTGAFHVVVI